MGRARSPVHGAADDLCLRQCADDAQPDGHHDRVRALLQHAARRDRPALVRPRRLLRAGRLPHRACHEHGDPRPSAGAAPADAAGRRLRRPAVRHHLRLGIDAARRHRVCHDLARPRRARRLELAHPARLLRRRGRGDHQPHQAAARVRAQFRPADRGLLSDRGVVPSGHAGDVCAQAHTVRPHVQRGARECRARAIRRLQSDHGALHRLFARRAVRRRRRRARGDQFRAGQFRFGRRRAVGAWCCSPPISAASAISSGR